jgi:hypothetical protein
MRSIFKAAGMLVLIGALVVVMGCDGSGDPGTVTVSDLNGTWTVVIAYNSGNTETWIIELSQSGGVLTGISYEAGYRDDSVPVTGTISGSSVTMREDWVDEEYIYTGTVNSDGIMSGTSGYDDGSDPGTWVGTRSNGQK